MDRKSFQRAMRAATSSHQRVAWFGALLAQASGVGDRLLIIGGSAIGIYTQGKYVSLDVDVVGDKERLIPVLAGWGFTPVAGRDHREYWALEPLGLVDLVGREPKSSLPGQVLETRYGPVRLGAVEDLVVRRLMRSGRERSSALYDEAVTLASRYSDDLDWEYIETLSRYERVLPLFEQLRDAVGRRPARTR